MIKNKSVLLRLSKIDYDKLTALAEDSKMKHNEFLRMLIQITFMANEIKENPNKEIHFGGYGITFPKEFLEDFTNRLKDCFVDFDFAKYEDNFKVRKTKRNQRTLEKA